MTKQFGQYLAIGSLSVSVLLASIATSMANIVLPAVALKFGVTFSEVRWVVLSYLLATTVFSLTVGRIGDLKGRRTILLGGTVFFAIGTIACAMSTSFWFLVFARVLQGIGGAALVVLPIAIVTEVASKEKIGRLIGLLATMSAIGTAAGPSLGGFLLQVHGWRAPFFLVAALGLLSLFLLLVFVPSDDSPEVERQENSAFLKTLAFIYLNPLLRIRLISNLVVAAVMMSTLIAGPFYLTHVLKYAPAHMGLVMSAGPITSIFFGILSGLLVDRFGFLSILKFGFIQILIGTLAFAFLPSLFGGAGFVLAAIFLSLGYQLFLSANSSCIMKNLAADRRGLISGALSLSRNLGLMSGTFVMGSIFEFCGLQITFLVAAFLIAILLFTQLKIQKRKTDGTKLAL